MNERDKPMARDDKGAHKAATGAGAVVGGAAGGVAGGAAAGAAMGGLTGPVGAAIGAVAGAVVGAMAGKGIANAVDPTVEDKYWRENYASRDYVAGGTYDDYGPAYLYGVDAYTRNPDRSFDDVEPELNRDWERSRGNSKLGWDNARHASRDAWHRVSNAAERVIPGDSDGDGR